MQHHVSIMMSKWYPCLTQDFQKMINNCSAISWREQDNYQWDEVHLVIDQHAEVNCYSTSSLKQQSEGRHVAPLGHIIMIPIQPVAALSAEKQQIPLLKSLAWPDVDSNPRSTVLETSTLTITPHMRFDHLISLSDIAAASGLCQGLKVIIQSHQWFHSLISWFHTKFQKVISWPHSWYHKLICWCHYWCHNLIT